MATRKKASDIKVGCIGYGGAFNMGRAHLNEMAKAGMTPTAVAEIDAARLDVHRRVFPVYCLIRPDNSCLRSRQKPCASNSNFRRLKLGNTRSRSTLHAAVPSIGAP